MSAFKEAVMESIGKSSCVAVFDRHEDAEAAIRKLQSTGFDMKRLSIVGKDYLTEEHPVGFYNAGHQVRYWGKQGAFWGSIFGILFAPAFFWIPGIGPILTGGGLIGSAIMGTLEGAAVGAAVGGASGALSAALVSLGIPKNTVIQYEASLKANKFLLIANGTAADAERARAVLAEMGVKDLQVHAS
ncbi:MAG: general stress protein [Polyangiaceae bacterium]